MACVYRHIRLDNNKVFYIGIGINTKRAYDIRQRNKYWHHVVNKHGYRVEVFLDNIDLDSAKIWEMYLIWLSGRADLGYGELVNMTDGGDGSINKSKEAIAKQLATAKANGTYDEMVKRISDIGRTMKRSGKDSHVRKEVYLFDIHKRYLNRFDTITMCADYINANVSHLSKYMNGNGSAKGFIFYDHMPTEEELNFINKIRIKQISVEKDGLVTDFLTMAAAARYLKTDRSYIHRLVKCGIKRYKDYKLIY